MSKRNSSSTAATLRLTLDHDTDAECPNEWGGWRLVSFGSRHTAYEEPGRYCAGLDPFGDPIPADIGVRRKLQTGTAFWLSYYEHGSCRWSLMGEGARCPWDSVRVAGILLWEATAGDLPRDHPAREADARRFTEAFTAWANGAVYGFRLEDASGEIIESCSGHYDPGLLFEEIREAVKGQPVEIAGDAGWLADYHSLAA